MTTTTDNEALDLTLTIGEWVYRVTSEDGGWYVGRYALSVPSTDRWEGTSSGFWSGLTAEYAMVVLSRWIESDTRASMRKRMIAMVDAELAGDEA